MNDQADSLVVDIAKGFISLVRKIEPRWAKAYLRIFHFDSMTEAKGSYIHGSSVEIINVLHHKEFFHPVTKKGQELLTALGKSEGLFLLIADSNFEYEIKFEYHDKHRWKISKLGGGTGVPEGIDSK